MTAVLFLLRAVVLVLMWGLVLAAVVAVRHDVFGTRARPATGPTGRGTPAAPPPSARRPSGRRSSARALVVTGGPLAGTSIPLADSPITIGRADSSTVVVADDYVSTHHARLVPRGDAWVLEDLNSTNGTFLDRTRVTTPTPVPIGAPIRIGKTTLELRR
jgi:pSer/pThr/pTyr-binding forkhead associated (FHA) protein